MASSIPRPRASLTVAQGLSPPMKVPLGSRVVLSRRRNGTVRYVGKIVNESGEWYGVVLDEPKGDNDGMRGKERYFYCPANYGIFVRRKEISYVKEPGSVLKGPPSPVTDEGSTCSSNVSTDQQGEVYGVIATNTDSSVSSSMKTFKGFRKQLDFISLRTVGPGRSREASPVTSPVSSSPSSPTAKSGLKPPSPFKRFASFSHGFPSPGSPTNKTIAASIEDRKRQSSIPLSPKPSPVRRVNSLRAAFSDSNEDSIRPVEATTPSSSNSFNSFQFSPANYFPVTEEKANTSEYEAPTRQLAPSAPGLSASIYSQENAVLPMADAIENATTSPPQSTDILVIDDECDEDQLQLSPSQQDGVTRPPGENSTLVQIANSIPANVQDSLHQERTDQIDSRVKSLERISTFRGSPIDIDAIAGTTKTKISPRRDFPVQGPQCFTGNSPIQDSKAQYEANQTSLLARTRSFRLSTRLSSFRIPSIDLLSKQGSVSSSPASSLPSRRSNSFEVLSLDYIGILNESEDSQDSLGSTVSSPWDNMSESSTTSAPELRKSPPSPRGRQELTTVESLSPGKKLTEIDAGSAKRPLFFRRMNVGHSPMERRSSYSSFSASSSSPKSTTSSSTSNTTSRSPRMTELEKEISAMRSSHENIVAVLRATNKQHAANVLELRAQVAALTEGNIWLERQLTAKGELVRELREMEKQQQRDTVSVSEVEKILEIKDAQIQILEREMAQLRQRLTRLEADKDSQLYQQFQHYEARRERDEKRINELRKEVLAMVRPYERSSNDPSRLTREMLYAYQCNERFELQSEVRDLKEMSLRFF